VKIERPKIIIDAKQYRTQTKYHKTNKNMTKSGLKKKSHMMKNTEGEASIYSNGRNKLLNIKPNTNNQTLITKHAHKQSTRA
jgi:hypothetical protein